MTTRSTRVEQLRTGIAELQALRVTIVNNPSQTINIAGISYTFQTQAEIDAVLNPMIKEYNFLEDIESGGEIADTTVLRAPNVLQAPIQFSDKGDGATTLTLPEGFEDTYETFVCVVAHLTNLNVRVDTHHIPVAFLAEEEQENLGINISGSVSWNGTTRRLSLTGASFLYAALIYKWY